MLVADNSLNRELNILLLIVELLMGALAVNANVKKSNWRLRISSGDNYYLDSYNRLSSLVPAYN